MGCFGALALFLVIVVIVLAAAGALDKPENGSTTARNQTEAVLPQQPPVQRAVATQEASPLPAAPSASASVEPGPTGDPRTDDVIAKLRAAHMLIDGKGEAFADLHEELGRHQTAEFLEGTHADDLVEILSREDSGPEEVRALLRSMDTAPGGDDRNREVSAPSPSDGFKGMSGSSILDLLTDLHKAGGDVSRQTGYDFSQERNFLFEVESQVGDYAIYKMRGARSPYRVAIRRLPGRVYARGQLLANEPHVLTGMETFETVLGSTEQILTMRPYISGVPPRANEASATTEEVGEEATATPGAAGAPPAFFRGDSGQNLQDLVYGVQGRRWDVSKLIGLAYRGVPSFRVESTVEGFVIYGFTAAGSHFQVGIVKEPGRYYGTGQVMPNRFAGGRDEFYVLTGVEEFTTVMGTTEQVLTLRVATQEERATIDAKRHEVAVENERVHVEATSSALDEYDSFLKGEPSPGTQGRGCTEIGWRGADCLRIARGDLDRLAKWDTFNWPPASRRLLQIDTQAPRCPDEATLSKLCSLRKLHDLVADQSGNEFETLRARSAESWWIPSSGQGPKKRGGKRSCRTPRENGHYSDLGPVLRLLRAVEAAPHPPTPSSSRGSPAVSADPLRRVG